jgi:hypothetical protein
VNLSEAIKTADALAEWYVEGFDEKGPEAERTKREIDMLEFFILLGKRLQEKREEYKNDEPGDVLTVRMLRGILNKIAGE